MTFHKSLRKFLLNLFESKMSRSKRKSNRGTIMNPTVSRVISFPFRAERLLQINCSLIVAGSVSVPQPVSLIHSPSFQPRTSHPSCKHAPRAAVCQRSNFFYYSPVDALSVCCLHTFFLTFPTFIDVNDLHCQHENELIHTFSFLLSYLLR